MNNRISIFWLKGHQFDFPSLFLLNLKRILPLSRKLQLIQSKKRENTRLPLHRRPQFPNSKPLICIPCFMQIV